MTAIADDRVPSLNRYCPRCGRLLILHSDSYIDRYRGFHVERTWWTCPGDRQHTFGARYAGGVTYEIVEEAEQMAMFEEERG
jgi:ribosomal protein S27AE